MPQEKFFRCKVGDRIYELDKLTLGDARLLRAEFGMGSLAELDHTNPEHLAGLLYLAIKQSRPRATAERIFEELNAIDLMNDFERLPDDADMGDDTDPLDEDEPVAPKAGNSATTRKTSGTRS